MSHNDHNNDSFSMNIDPDQNCSFFNKQKSNDTDIEEFNTMIKTNMFSIMHTNVISPSKKFNNLVTVIKLLNNEFSCIGISETWLNTSLPTNMFDIPNSVFVHKSRKSKRGGGVGISFKNSNKFKERTYLTIFEDGIFEYIFIEIENINTDKTLIGVIYRPPNHANRDIFEEKMQIILQNITINKNPLYIVGDFNINLLISETSANFLDLMSS